MIEKHFKELFFCLECSRVMVLYIVLTVCQILETKHSYTMCHCVNCINIPSLN
jgi:hypothetical protein